jgi:hypothetical protein
MSEFGSGRRGYACERCGCRRFTVCEETEGPDLECCGCGRWYDIRQVRPGWVSAGVHEAMACEAQANVRRGRPLLRDVDKTNGARRPWDALGMSERTWYRRREKREGK